MPKIDIGKLASRSSTAYPDQFKPVVAGREKTALGNAAGLTQFGVNLLRLPPGVWSSQRHWHTAQEEFVYILSGEVVLVTDSGEEILTAGDCAGFKAGDKDGHHLQNRSNTDALLLEIGTRIANDGGEYPDIDMAFQMGSGLPAYTRKDGTPYADIRRRGPEDD